MYNREIIGQLVDFISSKDGRTDKSRLQNEVQEAFGLVKDRSVYYCDWFAIRFCKAASRSFGNTVLALYIKTKVLFLSSNPKGYNIDKLLSFLSEEKSVYLVFVVAIDEDRTIQTRLCSMFNRQLLSGTRIIKHWAGRNSRGVTQYEGRVLEAIVEDFDSGIDYDASQDMITDFLRG